MAVRIRDHIGASAVSHSERLPLVTFFVAAALTLLLVFSPLRFAYRSTELRVLLETAQAVIAGLVALLLYGRHRRSGLWRDLLAAYSFALSGATSLFFALIPALAERPPGGRLDRFDTWAPLLARLVAGVTLAWSALAPRRWTHLRRRAAAMTGALAGTLVVIALVVWAAIEWLPPIVEESPLPGRSSRPDLDVPPGVLVAQVVLLVLAFLTAFGFSRQAERERNPLVMALASGSVVNAFARLNFFLYPSLYTDVVHVGDVLRLLFYLVLLAGAAAEIGGYWRVEAEAAAGLERQRLARSLHDGLAQELAFIRSHTAAMARGASPPGVAPLVAEAAERAMAESRRVVDALRSNGVTSLPQYLHDAADDAARAAGAEVEVTVDRSVWVPTAAQPEVSELVRRATNAAVRLRGASIVAVRLGVWEGRAVLAVEDNGRSADPASSDAEAARRDLVRRADQLGATCRALPGPDGGTRLEVVLPWRPLRRHRGQEPE